MGYRTYIAIIEKKKINKLRKCNSMEEVKSVFDLYGWNTCTWNDTDGYGNKITSYSCPVYELDYIAGHEFGKYYDNNYEDFDKKKKRVFKNKEVDACYDDYNFEYGGIELLELAIEDYRLRISKWFDNMKTPQTALEGWKLSGKTDEEIKELHYQYLLHEVDKKCEEWSCKWDYKPYNMNRNSNVCVRSWLYEYQIFDLVSLYKLFNPKKHYAVYYGY